MFFGWRGGVICLDETTVISKITSVLEETGYEYDMSIEGKMTLKTVFKVSKPENFKIGVNNIPIPFLSFPISGFQISDANKEVVRIFMKKFLEELPRKPWEYEKKEKVRLLFFYRYLPKFIKFYLLPLVLVCILLLCLGYRDIVVEIGVIIIGIVIASIFMFSLAPNLIPFMAKIQWRKWVK